MSVALVVTHADDDARRRLVPIATEELFRARWLCGAALLGLEWIERMETGFDITADNCDAILDELARLRAWMVVELGDGSYDVERLDRLVEELRALRFEPGLRVFVG